MCGVFGIAWDGNATGFLQEGLFHLHSRGERYVGRAFLGQGKEIENSFRSGLVDGNEDLFTKFEMENAIGHVSVKEPQPFLAHTKIGQIALAFSGNVINGQEIREGMIKNGCSFVSRNEVELLARLIGQYDDPVEGIKKMAERIKGAFSLVLLTQGGVYAARDPFGFRPLVIGKNSNGCAVASESPALIENGMELIRDVRPGEIILVEKQGFSKVGTIKSEKIAHCAFEWAYVARYDSIIDKVTVNEARDNLGAMLARGDNVDIDYVAPIPMSGIGHAIGYHHASGVPYREVYLYNRFSGRSYTPLTQEERDRVAKRKLSLIPGIVKGKRIAICDDSIVRGTQLRKQIHHLRQASVKEIHIRVASPPLVAPCRYGISTRSYNELIARRHSIEEIRKMLGADTLRYNSIDDFVSAIGIPAEKLCLSCWTDEYPV